MSSPLAAIMQSGTKLWLDSVDPKLVTSHRQLGVTGATSNPIIISQLIESGRYDAQLSELLNGQALSDHDAAWALTDQVVAAAEQEFLSVWQETAGDDGYVSFEVDPLLEAADNRLTHQERVAQYVELGTRWQQGHRNRMIKVPATPAGIEALETLAARGVPLNVTLIFTMRQYQAARDAIWRGAQRLESLDSFKSVYSIFVSRVDVFVTQELPPLSPQSQGLVGLLNAKQIWQENQDFWSQRPTPLQQEIVFASTGTKNADDSPWKYVAALVGSDIQTNPPAINEAVEASGQVFQRSIDDFPPPAVIEEIQAAVDMRQLEDQLMREGVQKFVDPQLALQTLIHNKRTSAETASP